jgi:predicted nucleic acid-binding protein
VASKKIFVDSSVLYAFVDRANADHIQAVKLFDQLSLQGTALFTSIQSIVDTNNAINNQLGATLSHDFLQAMTESSLEILYPQKADFIAAYKLIKLNRYKQIGLKEAINSVLMQKKGISQILTFSYWHNLLGSQSYLARY